MVQQYQSPVRVYKHPFELVMAVSGALFKSRAICSQTSDRTLHCPDVLK